MPLPTQQDIEKALEPLAALFEKTDKRFQTIDDLADTVIDPITVFTHLAFSRIQSKKDWFDFEKSRRVDKAFTNAIGKFHESVLESIPGWHKPESGFDLRSNRRKKVCLKLKINTILSTRQHLKRSTPVVKKFVQANQGWTTYLALIVPKKGKLDKPWVISGEN